MGKNNKIKLLAKRPGAIKAALKAWGDASDLVDADSLNTNGAPPWVENAWAEVVKVIMPSRKLPMSGDWDLELMGELLGRLQAFSKLYTGEIPLRADVQSECDRIKAIASRKKNREP